MKPIIGVMPLWDDERDSIWMLPGYTEGLKRAGALPLILPFTEDPDDTDRLADMCDGFLFTGGHDVSPRLYGETPLKNTVSCEKRDRMETAFLTRAISADKPILGICRGIQLINAALGGTLYQDLPSQHPSDTEHHQSPPYDVPSHNVELISGSPLQHLLCTDTLPVNSYHHQAVKDLSPKLLSMAVSPDGLTEAVYMPEHRFLWAVQWHPEFAYKTDKNSMAIFERFVAAAR